LVVIIDLGEREHEAFAIGDAVDGAGLAVEEDAGEEDYGPPQAAAVTLQW
jgi:hypothetical protein